MIEGYYFDDGIRKCSPKCTKCDDEDHCSECADGAFYDNEEETCRCKFGFLETISGECVKKGTSDTCLTSFVFEDGECIRCH
mmetsp:Transcript_26461/g.4604  ORF Transcript_26461/g.4604 Transcript_26461/m.4604 type:complete len:82 (-) Transcript_26461:3051-3296(-)